MSTISFFDFEVSKRGLNGDISMAKSLIDYRSTGHYMACLNPHSLVVASRDTEFKNALKKADILVPDGVGILLAAKILKLHINEKVSGYDFFVNLTDSLNTAFNYRYFFLGSTEYVLHAIANRIKQDFPSIAVCGVHSPPFKERFNKKDNDEIIDRINFARPDVLWVGMTAPKQEKWIYQNRDRLQVPFIAAIGAVFDFYAGTKKRSSNLWIKLGLEWLPRFVKEPKRLWERNLISTPVFLMWVLIEKFKILHRLKNL